MNKCEKKIRGYANKTCEAMQSVASIHPTKRQKGLFAHSMVNIETGEKLGVAISIRTENTPDGVFLNYCPFCGGELLDQTRFDEDNQKGEVK